jgi:hypothetical protein
MAPPRNHDTDRANRTLSIAHDCAQQANLDEVSPSLIFRGLAKGGRGVAHIVLESSSVDLSTLQH